MKPERPQKPTPITDLAEHVEISPAGDLCPKGTHISIKHIAFLYQYRNKHPRDIKARYPAALSHEAVHVALAHYFRHQDEFDAQIEEDRKLGTHDSLRQNGRLPKLGVDALLEAEEHEAKLALPKTSTLAKV
jgi:hypothetical protein